MSEDTPPGSVDPATDAGPGGEPDRNKDLQPGERAEEPRPKQPPTPPRPTDDDRAHREQLENAETSEDQPSG